MLTVFADVHALGPRVLDTGVALVTTLVEPTTAGSTAAEFAVGWIDNATLGAPGAGRFCDGGFGDGGFGDRRGSTLRWEHSGIVQKIHTSKCSTETKST